MTKTIDNVCADCWAVKEEPSLRLPRRPRTEPLFEIDWDDPVTWIALAVLALLAMGVLARWSSG